MPLVLCPCSHQTFQMSFTLKDLSQILKEINDGKVLEVISSLQSSSTFFWFSSTAVK